VGARLSREPRPLLTPQQEAVVGPVGALRQGGLLDYAHQDEASAAARPGGRAMSTAAEVAAALGGRATTTGWIARCPCHRDRVPSLSISEGAGDIVLLHCHAGCSQKALVAEVRHRGFTLGGRPLPTRRVIATYDYRDENGNLIYQVQRWAPKEFRQRRPDGKDGWINNIDGVVRLPYRLPRMLASAEKPVFIVEGEKDADRLTQAGLVATTNSGGASASRSWSSMAQWFKDRRVVILPENDEAGRRHASSHR
jgi:putative DNA primase/helicase